MNFSNQYPDYAVIESHIRRARAERSVAVAQAFVGMVDGVVRGVKRLVSALGRGIEAERDRRAVESDAFLKRSVPRY